MQLLSHYPAPKQKTTLFRTKKSLFHVPRSSPTARQLQPRSRTSVPENFHDDSTEDISILTRAEIKWTRLLGNNITSAYMYTFRQLYNAACLFEKVERRSSALGEAITYEARRQAVCRPRE